MRDDYDSVIIGAGQSGLAMSAVLQRRGRERVYLSVSRQRRTTAVPGLAQMFATHYGNRTRTRASKQTTSSRRGHAGKR